MTIGDWLLGWLNNAHALAEAREEHVETALQLREATEGWDIAEREIRSLTDALSETMHHLTMVEAERDQAVKDRDDLLNIRSNNDVYGLIDKGEAA